MGCLLIAVKNLAEQCYLQHYGPLEEIDMLTMMDMVKVMSNCIVISIYLEISPHLFSHLVYIEFFIFFFF